MFETPIYFSGVDCINNKEVGAGWTEKHSVGVAQTAEQLFNDPEMLSEAQMDDHDAAADRAFRFWQ